MASISGRLIYYHCTGYKGKCPEKWVREEELDRQFGEALAAIAIDDKALTWFVPAHQSANVSYIDSGVEILELAQGAGILYESQSMQEKRRILRFVL